MTPWTSTFQKIAKITRSRALKIATSRLVKIAKFARFARFSLGTTPLDPPIIQHPRQLSLRYFGSILYQFGVISRVTFLLPVEGGGGPKTPQFFETVSLRHTHKGICLGDLLISKGEEPAFCRLPDTDAVG